MSAWVQGGVARFAPVVSYDRGGHGYGLRPTEMLVTTWPKRCEEWLKTNKLLTIRSTKSEAPNPKQARNSKHE